MKLIKTSSIEEPTGLVFREFSGDQIPPYAILSHTWGEDEVIWADFQRGTATSKASFGKVKNSCFQAKEDGLAWVWIDSCCINKDSSAELSEAINSMYAWYRQANICYAHLEGVTAAADTTITNGEFARCRWFTRGWTLQELLAPSNLAFFSEDWVKIGDKVAICRSLSAITGIDEEILTGAKALQSASVSKRMSWASHRKTTRSEDMAYCLMGIFDVNMPMLYGEGQRAFLRLQEEIMKQSDDQSLFAWANTNASAESYHGLLADSPLDFAFSNSIMPYQDWEPRMPYQLTNRGLRIELPMAPCDDSGTVFVAAIDCPAPPNYEDSSYLALYLKKISQGNQQYVRIKTGQFARVQERGVRREVYVRQHLGGMVDSEGVFPRHVIQLRRGPPTDQYWIQKVIVNEKLGDSAPDIITSSRATVRNWLPQPHRVSFVLSKVPGQLSAALVMQRLVDGERIAILLGSVEGMKVGFCAMELGPRDDDVEGKDEPGMAFEDLQERFRQSSFPPTKYNLAFVDFETKVIDSCKFHLVDLQISNIRSPGIAEEMVSAAVDVYDIATGQEHRKENRVSTFWKRLVN